MLQGDPDRRSVKLFHSSGCEYNCRIVQAFGAVEAMTDRYCIHMNKQFHISANELTACCYSCGMGCVHKLYSYFVCV